MSATEPHASDPGGDPRPSLDLTELTRAERALREYAARRREVERLGSLCVYRTPGSAAPFLTAALPCDEDEPADWGPSIEALVRASAGGWPRFEFMRELHPALEEALLAIGFERAMVAPVLTAPAGAWAAPPATTETWQDLREAPEAALEAFVEAQGEAFGMPPLAVQVFLPVLRSALAEGRMLAGQFVLDGRPVGGATLQLAPSGAELAGVWTRPDARRRGLGFATCATLLARARSHGVAWAWLSAAEGAEGVYRRLGFRRAGTQVDLAGPRG